MKSKTRRLACLAVIALASCAGETTPAPKTQASRPPAVEIAGVRLVPTGQTVQDECDTLRQKVGYPPPCPRLLPENATPYWGRPTGSSKVFQTGKGRLRRWVWLSVTFVGGSQVGDHLVISAAPEEVDARHLIFTPRPYPGVALNRNGHSRLQGRRATWVYVRTGESIYTGHTVLVWSEFGHTYGVGFHGKGSAVRDLGLAVARSLHSAT